MPGTLGATITKVEQENCVASLTTKVTVHIERRDQYDCPPPPNEAVVGDDWISLVGPHDSSRLTELGYWPLEPEGTAMFFLRCAWMAAHAELRKKNEPWDGNTQSIWRTD